jgi:hypothetical protein
MKKKIARGITQPGPTMVPRMGQASIYSPIRGNVTYVWPKSGLGFLRKILVDSFF